MKKLINKTACYIIPIALVALIFLGVSGVISNGTGKAGQIYTATDRYGHNVRVKLPAGLLIGQTYITENGNYFTIKQLY